MQHVACVVTTPHSPKSHKKKEENFFSLLLSLSVLLTTACTDGLKCIMFNYALAVKPSSSKYYRITEECRKQSWIYTRPCLGKRRGEKITVMMDILQKCIQPLCKHGGGIHFSR